MTSELLGAERLHFINTQLRSSVGSPRLHLGTGVRGTVWCRALRKIQGSQRSPQIDFCALFKPHLVHQCSSIKVQLEQPGLAPQPSGYIKLIIMT